MTRKVMLYFAIPQFSAYGLFDSVNVENVYESPFQLVQAADSQLH